MGEKGDDRRVQKTRKLLHDALTSLMVEKDYGSITVQEIIDRANVGRTTFYAHFADKDDLVIWALQRLRETLEDALAQAPRAHPAGPGEQFVAFGLPAFEHLFSHQPMYRAIMRSRARGIVMDHMPVMLAGLIKGGGRQKSRSYRKGDADIPYDLLLHFVVSTFGALVSWWLDSPDPLPPKEIDAIFRALVLEDLRID